MENRPFREYHILKLLEEYDNQNLPLDLHIRNYFRSHKSLGSKDRGEVASTVYGIIRQQILLDYLLESPLSWEKRLSLYLSNPIEALQKQTSIPERIRLSFPEELFAAILSSHGPEKGKELCLASNYPAPTTIRVNPAKISREELLLHWRDLYNISACKYSPYGIVFHKKINFFSLPEFHQGLFEIQDEGSQILASLVDPKPGQQVMDYCAGSGGKTLAFAHKMQNKGQIYLHDIRKRILSEGKKRLKRAGIQNAQLLEHDSPKLKNLKKKMDWVLVDAPCTGTGTLRRNPEMKEKFSQQMLKRLIGQQRVIFEKALSFVKPSGKIIYGTCSLLKDENEKQLEHFLSTYPLELVCEPFCSLPQENAMDGFFGAVMKVKNKEM